jgi:hypothetical protein
MAWAMHQDPYVCGYSDIHDVIVCNILSYNLKCYELFFDYGLNLEPNFSCV